MKSKLITMAGVLLCAGLAYAGVINSNHLVDRPLLSLSAFTLYPTDSTTLTVVKNSQQPVSESADDTLTSLEIGAFRQVVTLIRIDASSTDSTDDSVDTRLYFDKSWDGANWAVYDSVDITDTLPITKRIDSAATVEAAWLRVRLSPITGIRVDTLGIRPVLTVRVIAK